MKIRLADIPREGSSWTLRRGQEEELDQALNDLIGEQEPYEVTLSVRPLDQLGTFHVDGALRTQWDEACSRCAEDFKFKVSQSFRDLLIPKLEMPRNGSTAKPHGTEHHGLGNQDVSAYEYEANHFDLGEFLHEVLALARPLAPQPEEDEKGSCILCCKTKEEIFALVQKPYEEDQDLKPPSPFDILKNLKN
jgi:uncharacterized protein